MIGFSYHFQSGRVSVDVVAADVVAVDVVVDVNNDSVVVGIERMDGDEALDEGRDVGVDMM